MSVADDIKAAAAEGRAALAAAKAAKAEKDAEEARRQEQWRQEYAVQCDAWVRDELPSLVRAAAAKGQQYTLTDDEKAAACRRAGLTLTSEYVPEWHDDGCTFGDYHTYTVVV